MIRVTITVEQDAVSGPWPTSQTYQHTMSYSTSNPRFLVDGIQTAVVRAAADVVHAVGTRVDLRNEGTHDGETRPEILQDVDKLLADIEGVVAE